MKFSGTDRHHMTLAIEQAKLALAEGNFPVGAVLTIDGEMIDAERNSIKSNSDWVSHAELNIICRHASLIKESVKNKNSTVTIYTTLEPCLMCFGASVLNRISRIVYACPDPFTGATSIVPDMLPIGYENMLPEVQGGLLQKESSSLVMKSMRREKTDKWRNAIELYQKIL